MLQSIVPKDKKEWLEMRTKVLTSTEIGAIFNISPYSTLYETWMRKKNQQYVELEPNQRMTWGLRLEKSIAEGVAEEKGFPIRKMEEFYFDLDTRLGCSLDYSIETDPLGILECKNVDSLNYKNEWVVDEKGDTQEPLHIAIQCQFQMLVTGRTFLWLAALVGGNNLVLIKRTQDLRVHEAIKHKVAEFWKSIDENCPPAPDFDQDADFIKSLFGYSEPGTVLDVKDNSRISLLAGNYKELGDQAKRIETEREAIKAELLTMLGTAEKAIGEGFSISAGMIGPCHVEYDRAGYRSFKVTFKKEK